MITIKEFAALCDCSTQTLRYYDKIDLLKPVKVDQWSGYRYYTKSQAIDFVKIKNLQAADFTIKEIKKLLSLSDTQVYEAFDRKIVEQTGKLERIKEIQQSYLTEVNTMKKTINSFCDHLLERANDPQMLAEFGLHPDDSTQMVETIRTLMFSCASKSNEEGHAINISIDGKLTEGTQAIEKMISLLQEEDSKYAICLDEDPIPKTPAQLTENTESVWEAHGWNHVYEFLDEIPPLEDGKKYTILLHLHNKPNGHTLSYPLLMNSLMLMRGSSAAAELHCIIEHSPDEGNHFALLKEK